MKAFESLALTLRGHFEKPFAQLRRDLQQRVQADFAPWSWDGKSPRQRCLRAKQWDYENDPARGEVRDGIEALTNPDSPSYSLEETQRLRGDFLPVKHGRSTPKDLPSLAWSLDAAVVIRQPNTSTPEAVAIGTICTDKGSPIPKHDWRMSVQAEAYQQWVRLVSSGANPTIRSICDWVAQWCVKNEVRTDSLKIFPNSEYLRTHVLSGKLWHPPHGLTVADAKAHVEQMEQMEQAKLREVSQTR
jgi:hypothetical protein